MKTKTVRERLLASSMICGVALAAGHAYAADTETEVTEIVVTGSRIPTPNLNSISPVTAIGSADIKAQGVTGILVTHNLEDALRVGDAFMLLRDGKVLWTGRQDEVKRKGEEFLMAFFRGEQL